MELSEKFIFLTILTNDGRAYFFEIRPQTIHFVMFVNFQIGGVLFKVVTNMKIIECTGHKCYDKIGSIQSKCVL